MSQSPMSRLQPAIMSELQLSTFIDVKPRTLREWRYRGVISFLKIRRKIQYNVSHVLAALDKFEKGTEG
jgi:hypothetical protein